MRFACQPLFGTEHEANDLLKILLHYSDNHLHIALRRHFESFLFEFNFFCPVLTKGLAPSVYLQPELLLLHEGMNRIDGRVLFVVRRKDRLKIIIRRLSQASI